VTTAPTARQSEPFVDDLCFSESPRWHDGRLWFSDFYDSAVYSVDPAGRRRQEVDVPGQPGGLGWLPDGRLLVASRLERLVYRLEPDGALVLHGQLRPWATFHANDMVVSAEGRAYVGNFGFDLDAASGEREWEDIATPGGHDTAVLVRVDPDGTSHLAAEELSFPNGSVITPEGRTLIVAESLAARLSAFTVAADGTLSDRRVWAGTGTAAPDGICLDAEGGVWVANARAAECLRLAEGGRVLDRVVTSQRCFACMLGGEDRRTLYCVTAPADTSEGPGADRGGRIEAVVVPVPGAGLP
jgi:sugar lactone lactonase YvrE